MSTLIIDNKEYVVLEKIEYYKLLENASRKTPAMRKLTLKEGKKLAYFLIDKWHKGK